MGDGIYWIILAPIILGVILYYLGFLTIGVAFIRSAFSRRRAGSRFLLLTLGLAVLLAPLGLKTVRDMDAEQKTDLRQDYLASLERVDLSGRLPRKFVTVGNFSAADIAFIKSNYRMAQFPEAETQRLRTAYRNYRRAEYCHSHSSGKMMSPKLQIPVCRDLPESLQSVLQLREPVLFIAEGASTSHRQSNTFVGDMYEIRWVTPYEDRLVDYYEQRMAPSPLHITNPFTSGWIRDPDDKGMTRQAFIEAALDKAI